MRIVKTIWTYFGQSQPVSIRVLHLAVIFLVASQLITSNFVDLDHARRLGDSLSFDFGTWTHILPGMALAAIATIFVLTELFRRGLKFFFPYLWGDWSALKSDLKTLAGRKLPEALPGGLAAIIQGLGLGALSLTLISGLTWFLLAQAGSGLAHAAIELHQILTSLVVVYVIGHGGMGVLHIFLWLRTRSR
ncbi:MAG: cytochrome b/b6 domain-containing protein [Deltaproteobacteria bacterium]|nr:cytochrome b/b6 domain-containing protein [Deltaproteobacteria bacterium]